MRIDIELAVQDAGGIGVAARIGAARVELCSALALGGLTPSLATIEQAVAAGRTARNRVGVHVLIRPRAGDFVFDSSQVEVMVADVRHAVAAGAAGIVIGALTPAGLPDLDVHARLIAAAEGVEVTVHRAVDVAADTHAAVGMLLGTGVTRVLTSGGAPSALKGAGVLARLVAEYGEHLQIQAGSGITEANVAAVAATGVRAIHFSAKRTVAGSGIALGAADTGSYEVTDPAIAAAVAAALAAANPRTIE